ncbi:unnamed protein product, partial [marine sediment metagenome]
LPLNQICIVDAGEKYDNRYILNKVGKDNTFYLDSREYRRVKRILKDNGLEEIKGIIKKVDTNPIDGLEIGPD